MFGKTASLHGQNTLVFEIFPSDIGSTCDGFSTLWSYCGLGHPHLDEYRMGIMVCNLNLRSIYVATNLHRVVHGGISPCSAANYVSTMLKRGYEMQNEESFCPNSKHILVVGSNESAIVPNVLSFFNHGTDRFSHAIEDFMKKIDLQSYGLSLLKAMDKRSKSTQETSRGQPLVLNLSYSIQNCLDNTTVPGMFLPKVTTKDLSNIFTHDTNIPISFKMLDMMTEATSFLQTSYEAASQQQPFSNERRNALFGNRIGKVISHPDLNYVSKNCFEGMTGGFKTQQQFGFGSHVDVQNSYSDPSYSSVVVASEVMDVPANSHIPFGSPTCKMFPFGIFFNRRGCETRCEYENKTRAWLNDVIAYYNSMPTKLKTTASDLFNIDGNMDITHALKERNGVTIIHRSPHADKHVQLSSFCDTLVDLQTNLPWWNEYYTVEYLYFVGLVCTPVSPRFAVQKIKQRYPNFPPSSCLTLLLIEEANRSQGGINKASGHRYSPSCGKNMPEGYLYLSLKNLYDILQDSKTNSNTSEIVARISKHPAKGGVFKVGPLSAYEVLSIFSMSTSGGNSAHALNAVIANNNNASKFLEKRYLFTASQRAKLLEYAAQYAPQIPTHIVENVSCKMSYDYNNVRANRCDTIFSDQKYLFFIKDNTVFCVDKDGNETPMHDILDWKREVLRKMSERLNMRWFDMSNNDLLNLDGLDEIKFVESEDLCLEKVTDIYNHARFLSSSGISNKTTKTTSTRNKRGTKCGGKPSDIITTEFGPRSIDYIKKRCGATARKEGKARKKKSRKRKKCDHMNDNEEYLEASTPHKVTKAPGFITLVDYMSQKHVDFKTMASMLLGITYQELLHSISFELSEESDEVVYWDAKFSHERLGLNVALTDIEFSFDTSHYCCKKGSSVMYYRSKNAALRHLLLKIIMIVKPNIINEWMKKADYRPIVIHENCRGKLTTKIEYVDGIRSKQRFGLTGWFVIFCHRKKIYGCDLSLPNFDQSGKCLLIEKEKRKHIFCFSS